MGSWYDLPLMVRKQALGMIRLFVTLLMAIPHTETMWGDTIASALRMAAAHLEICPKCAGAGYIHQIKGSWVDGKREEIKCEACKGSGEAQ